MTYSRRVRRAVGVLTILFASSALGWAQGKPEALPIATVHHLGGMWISTADAARALGFQLQYQPEQKQLLATHEDRTAAATFDGGQYWASADGRAFVPVRWLTKLGYGVRWNEQAHHAVVTWDSQSGLLTYQPRGIAVNLQRQVLFAREGGVVVYEFRVSTGRAGHRTPDGDYKVLRKQAMHVSTLYPKPHGGAKMPYSLWFTTAYYIHGYHSVPHHPASHGCIRLTIPNAKTLYDWAPVGTPVRVYRTPTE